MQSSLIESNQKIYVYGSHCETLFETEEEREEALIEFNSFTSIEVQRLVAKSFRMAESKVQVMKGKWTRFKHAFSSRQAFLDAVRVEPISGSDRKPNKWINEGMLYIAHTTPVVVMEKGQTSILTCVIDLAPTPPALQSKS